MGKRAASRVKVLSLVPGSLRSTADVVLGLSEDEFVHTLDSTNV